jgi:hypothetical protein
MSPTKINTPCIVDGMPMEVYHGDPCPTPALSNSIIKPLLTKSPYHAFLQHPRLNPDCIQEEGARLDLGTAAHGLLLEGEHALDRCVIIDANDYKTKRAQEQRDAAHAEGKTPLLAEQFKAAAAMVLRAHEFIECTELAGIFQRGKPEQSMFWQSEGVWFKGRHDWLTEERDVILDYKTTGLEPAKWERSMRDHGYHTQSVLYMKGLSALGHRNARFVFLVQETCEPYHCWLMECTPSLIELADMQIARATRLWKQCLERQQWPSYPLTVQPASAPSWALAEEESLQ